MAFRLKPKESARTGLRRILRREIQAAITELETHRLSSDRIHEARKHIKKARAIVRFVERDMHVGKVPDRLRHAGRLLSPLRDAQTIAEDAAELCSSEGRAISRDTCRALRNILEQRKVRSRRSAKRHHAVNHARTALAHVRRSVKTWQWSEIGNRHLNAAIKDSYKRARRAMKRAKAGDDATLFHDWRKRVKVLWYALRMLEPTVPAVHRQVAELERVETLLGHDHNLSVLRTTVKNKLPPVQGAERISGLAARRQEQLRAMAIEAAAVLFRARPKTFGKRVRHVPAS